MLLLENKKEFIIIPQSESKYPINSIFAYYGCDCRAEFDRNAYYIGCIIGNLQDEVFSARVQRVERKLSAALVKHFHYSMNGVEDKVIKRLTDLERYNRMVSKVTNKYNSRKELLSKTLSFQEDFEDLEIDYQKSIQKLRLTYNQL